MRCGDHERDRGEAVNGLSCMICNLSFIVSQETNAVLMEVPKISVLAICVICDHFVYLSASDCIEYGTVQQNR